MARGRSLHGHWSPRLGFVAAVTGSTAGDAIHERSTRLSELARMPDRILVEVAHARPHKQLVLAVELPRGASVADAVRASGIASYFPDLDLEHAALGIYGKRVTREHELAPGDRVEIYRSLAADPKEVRRRLAAQGKTMGGRRRPRPR